MAVDAPAEVGHVVGPIRLPARYVSAGALFHTGQVLLWGEARHTLYRIPRFLHLVRTPLVEQEINWVILDASADAGGGHVRGKREIELRIQASGKYHGEPGDPRSNIWCSGTCFLPDGRLLVAGADSDSHETPDTIDRRSRLARIVSPTGSLFGIGGAPDMHAPRWYPGLVTMPDGRALASFGVALKLEIFDPETNTWLERASTRTVDAHGLHDDYPWTFVMPDGRVLLIGAWGPETYLYDPETDRVVFVASQSDHRHRHGGSAVLLAPAQEGKAMVLGGGPHGSRGTASVELFDFATRRWSAGAPMSRPRHHLGCVVLPTGQVWVTGGGGGRFHFFESVGRETELYDPATNTWKRTVRLIRRRGYHHVCLLLPDGSVLVAGEGATAEVYYPPYFFSGPRPVVRKAPDHVRYKSRFRLEFEEPSGDPVDAVVLVRQGSMTHSYNFDHRVVALTFSRRGPGVLQVAAPQNSRHAPPGYYMLFLVSRAGLPSRSAAWVRAG